jgi:uncharacterized protein (TIGR02145 family)
MKRNYLYGLMLFMIASLVCTNCKKDNGSLSTVTTLPPYAVASTEATLGISVESDGGSHIIECGMYISSSQDPEKSGQRFQIGNDTGFFAGQISGLLPDEQYYFKAFAKNEIGESLGNEVNFLTPATVKDIENNVYETVKIETQVWMAQNLKTASYRNGDPIGTTSPATADITGESTPEYQWAYNGEETNVGIYGRLYTGYAVTDSRGICPTGWHIPSDSEWTLLTNLLGGEDYVGGFLKETGTDHWDSPNTGATNQALFSALPGGAREDASSSFINIGAGCYFWSSTDFDITNAWYRHLSNSTVAVGRIGSGKGAGFSVRCVKD